MVRQIPQINVMPQASGDHWDYHVTSDIEIVVDNKTRCLGAWVKCGENAAIRLHNVDAAGTAIASNVGVFPPEQLFAFRIFLEIIEGLCQ